MFNEILYRPIFNALVLLYNYAAWQDLGIAIILLTVLIRIILFPLFHISMRHQLVMQRLQPHVKKIQKDHKDNREKQAQALMSLYKEHRVNPFSGLLLMIVQFPIFIALYQVFSSGFTPENFGQLYAFVLPPTTVNHFFLNAIDLQERNIILVGLAAIAQYFQGKLTLTSKSEKIAKQMVVFGPALTIAIMYFLPAAVALYWLVSSLFSIFQQVIIMKFIDYDERLSTDSKTD